MALKKAIIQDNGIVTEYHRIFDIENIINDRTRIKVYSYINQAEREKEKRNPKYSPRGNYIYIVKSIENLDYDDSLTIDKAYEYLKTTEKYKGAEDV